MHEIVNIIIMTRNEGNHLKYCIESIYNHTRYPFKVTIVDNASDSCEHLQILKEIKSKYDLEVVYNKRNLWVLGLNHVLDSLYIKRKSELFVLTDGDMLVPETVPGHSCWLSYLVHSMQKYVCIGKLGFSLDWEYLQKHKALISILEQEKSLYNEQKKISSFYVSPVDTTLAIYRWDWSYSGGYHFFPDHMKYLKPEYYSCRTPREITATHRGWLDYLDDRYLTSNVNSKVICFTIVAGDIKKSILASASVPHRLFYIFFNKAFKAYWILKRLFSMYKYVLSKGLRAFNNT